LTIGGVFVTFQYLMAKKNLDISKSENCQRLRCDPKNAETLPDIATDGKGGGTKSLNHIFELRNRLFQFYS